MDISTGGNSWTWDFGNGVTSNEQNPTYVYSQPGFYTVSLTVSDGVNSDTETKSALIRVNASPIPNFSVNEANGCSPHEAKFTDFTIPVSGTISEWFWAFGNGKTSTEQYPTTVYTEIKDYDVFLKVKDINGCEASISKSDFIKLDGPEANFVYDSVVCGLPANVTFLNQSKGNDLSYVWDFGDGSSTTGDVPGTHTYTSFSDTYVTLVVTEKKTGCSDTLKRSLVIGDYHATFDWNIVCGDDEFTIEVENTTDVFATLEWDFGGEATKFTPVASHDFSSKGPYEITLKATVDPSCWDTTTITYNLPFPNLTYTSPICSDPFEVTFENKSSGYNLNYDWAFGDSTFSNEVNPIHSYDIPPEQYQVKLIAEDEFGCSDSITRNVKVQFPIARFYEQDSIYTGCAPLNLTFKDTSYVIDSEITSVKWDFGDPASGAANTSTERSPSHSFAEPGDYDITYIIYTDTGCADTVVYEAFIKAGEKPTFAEFDQLSNDSICYGDNIEFVESATYATSWIESNYFCWAFEEDGNSLLPDPESPPFDCPNAPTKTYRNNPYINFSNPKHTYNEFNHDADTVAPSVYTGEIIPNAGNLFTHLIIGYNNCFTEVINPTFVDTTISVNGYVLPDSLELFSDSTIDVGLYQASLNYDSIAYSYVYSGSSKDTLFKISETDTLEFTFEEGKKYIIRTKVVNEASGCENEISDVFAVDSVRLDFEMVNRQCLNDNPVLFDDNSFAKYGGVQERNWYVNDKKVFSKVRDDSSYYSFPDTGLYDVKLELLFGISYTKYGKKKTGYFTKSLTKQIKIEGVKARGYSDTLAICGGETITFTDTSASTTNITSYEWKFGYDTDSSTLQSPTHIYQKAGIYRPSLVVTDDFGCYDSLVLPAITVNRPIVAFEVSDSLICKGDAIAIKNNSIGSSLSFTWTIDSLVQSNIDIVQKFDSVGEFDVKLHAIDLFGCEDSLIKPNRIEVSDFPEADFLGSPLYVDCPPLTSNFADSTKTPVLKWRWDFGDGKTSTEQNPPHIYTTPGKYDVTLIVTNFAGCEDTLKKAEYVEIDGPNGDAIFDLDSLCIPQEVKFDVDFENTLFYILNYGDGDIISYTYSEFPDSVKHNYIIGGTFQPSIELIDASGCFYTLPELPNIQGDSIKAQFETSSNIICDVLNIPFTNTSRYSFDSEFIWDFGDLDSSLLKSPIHSYSTDSTYRVSLTQNSPIGCVDTISKVLTVFNAPFPSLEIQNDNYCIPSETELKLVFGNNKFIADNIYFTLNETDIHEGDSIVKTFTQDGNQKVKYTIEYGSGNCLTDSIFNIDFYKWPIANFSYNPSHTSIEDPVIFFKDESENTSLWSWDFGDFEFSSIQNPGHSFDLAKKYDVRLIASNQGGCSDTISKVVSVAPYDFVKMPSAFSPNGDGQNETFSILRAGDLEILEFKIFNRWGNVVFESNNVNAKWDGKRKGKDQNTGTYIYYVKGQQKDGEIVEIKGNFTLLR